MADQITVGTITTTNPTLWIDTNTLGADPAVYRIATAPPGNNWILVNQFCSLLSLKWLTGGRGTNPYGLNNFSDQDKIGMARTLIGYSSMQDQVNTAVNQLGGAQQTLATVTTGVQGGGYKAGTRIWAGDNFHVIAIYIVDATNFELYDSNTGATTTRRRSDFGVLMDRLRCDAFVVR